MINNSKKIQLYKKLLRIRSVEYSISEKYNEQKMRCPIHLSIGQEAIAVGICSNLKKEDKVFTAHRSHAHYLAKGGSLKKMIAELHGKLSGCAKGKGGSMHLIDLDFGILGAVPIVGSTIPIGVGAAWAEKLKNSKNIVVIFFGEGATEEGVFQESLDYAALRKLPVLFVCENNNYSVYSSIEKRQAPNRSILRLAKSIGVDGFHLDGNDISKIYNKSKELITIIKKKKKPFLLLLDTFRHLEHCGPSNDDILNYRSKTYINFWLNKDPIKRFEKDLLRRNILTNKIIRNLKQDIQSEIKRAFSFAENSNFPSKKELHKDIYA
jgi:TPP-dependent pyruvate/acetoin dehydrogenase alpha subunit